jgi:hypothetical protein
MKIIAQTPTELILRDSGVVLRVMGLFLGALGGWALFIGLAQPEGRGAIVPIVIGSLIALGGVLLVVLPARRTFAFSRAERLFIIANQRFGRVERQIIPLDQVADVSLEESASSDGNTYRISVTLTDQRRIPWTSYYSSGHASKQVVVDLVRDFLRLEPTPAQGSGALTPQGERTVRRSRAFLWLMGAFCCVFLAIGARMLAKEQHRLSVFRPVQATVLSTRVDEHSDSDGSTYEPVVVYRYRVDDRSYTASRVTPLRESRSGSWASRVAGGYQVGNTYTAFYDPENPADAYLLRSRSVIPWAFVAFSVVGLAIIAAAIRGTREMTRMAYRARAVTVRR